MKNGLQVGIGSGFTNEWSGTSAILNMARWSNVGLTGRWMYRVDDLTIIAPNNIDMPGKVTFLPVVWFK
jgi:Nidogen-like